MSNLIILVLVLLLSVLVIGMTSYYMSNSYSESDIQARAAAMVSEGQQVSAAAQMFDADNPHGEISKVEDLTPKYLTGVPKDWQMGSSTPVSTALPHHFARVVPNNKYSKDICDEANKKMGVKTTPSCSDLPAQFLGCCVADAPTTP